MDRSNMDNSEHTSVNINQLADSMNGELQKLNPISQQVCIYRVPEPKRSLEPTDYTPKMVSIGPLHHGKEEFQHMEEHKLRYLQEFLQLFGKGGVEIDEFLSLIKDKEEELRKYYAESIQLESDKFVRMILVDAVFLIQYCMKTWNPLLFVADDDLIFRKPHLSDYIWSDLWLVENQLPLFILNDLFNLPRAKNHGDTNLNFFSVFACAFSKNVFKFLPLEDDLLQQHFSQAKHLLDLVRLSLRPSQSRTPTEFEAKYIHSATELHQAGVKFKRKLGSRKNLLDMTFNEEKGILEMEFFPVYSNARSLYTNIIAFEQMHANTHCFNDYVIFMGSLINSTKDAELLIQSEVIGHANCDTLSTYFQGLGCNVFPGDYQYAGVVEDLHTYYDSTWHKWKAILKQDYFYTPWAYISFGVAVILLVLTIIQTVCSVISL